MYTPVRPFGTRCAYLSGVACNMQGGEAFEGKVGASELLCLAFGDSVGKAARSAIGVNVLPGNVPVEIGLIVELRD